MMVGVGTTYLERPKYLWLVRNLPEVNCSLDYLHYC